MLLIFLKLVTFIVLLTGCSSKPVQPQAVPDPCWRARLGLDIGSGSSKARSAIVDVCHQRLVRELARGHRVIGFKDHLSTRPAAQKSFTPEFLAASESEIASMVESVQKDTLNQLRSDPKVAALADSPVEIAGVATEAFRQSANSADFIRDLERNQGIRIQTIDQVKEGHLGFLGVMAALSLSDASLSLDPVKIASWDIGGGSLQMVARPSSDQWLDFGNQLASNPLRVLVLEKFKKVPAFRGDHQVVSPNPILSARGSEARRQLELQRLRNFVRAHVTREMKALLKAGWMKGSILKAAGREVYGIGGVHNGLVRFVRQQTANSQLHELTPVLLEQALKVAAFADDARLVSEFQVRPEYVSVIVTNMLLVQSVMEILNLDRINVLDVDNTYAVLVSPEFWSQLKSP